LPESLTLLIKWKSRFFHVLVWKTNLILAPVERRFIVFDQGILGISLNDNSGNRIF